MSRLFAVAFAFFCAIESIDAQVERFEIGFRVRALEDAWERNSERRPEAVSTVDSAVRSFLSFRAGQVALEVDRARRILQGQPSEPTWADMLSVIPSPRVLAAESALTLRVGRTYGEAEPPDESSVEVWMRTALASTFQRLGDVAPGDSVTELPLMLDEDSIGADTDIELEFRVRSGDRVVRTWRDVISRVSRFEERLASTLEDLERIDSESAESADATLRLELATARRSRLRLAALANGFVFESPLSAAAALAEVERLIERAGSSGDEEPSSTESPLTSPGDHWIALPTASGEKICRWWIPPGASSAEKRPLVIALHGAGGTEHLFFESYGSGRIVDLCRERGWILIAPRSGFGWGSDAGEVLDAALELLPVDPDEVYLVGHSMGAMQAVRAAVTEPKRYAGVACLGGGGSVPRNAPIAGLRVFVSAGEFDFAKGQAAALRRALEARGAIVRGRDVPGCEHLFIVSEALPNAFRFFDEKETTTSGPAE